MGLFACCNHSLCVLLVGLIRWSSFEVKCYPPGMFILWLSAGRGGGVSSAAQGQLLYMMYLGLPGRSYKEIHLYSLPELDLEVYGRGHMVN